MTSEHHSLPVLPSKTAISSHMLSPSLHSLKPSAFESQSLGGGCDPWYQQEVQDMTVNAWETVKEVRD